jgi:hypothetical protein
MASGVYLSFFGSFVFGTPGFPLSDVDIPDAEVRFLDTGHFALETHAAEIGAAMGDFLGRAFAR